MVTIISSLLLKITSAFENSVNTINWISDKTMLDGIPENFVQMASELAKKEELHFGKKWDKQKNLRLTLFKSKSALKKAIVVKEILDKPLSLRK